MASVRKRTLPSGNIAYQCDYIDNQGKRRSKQFKRKKEADAYRRKVEGEVAAGIHIPDRESATVQAAYDYLIKALKGAKSAQTTIDGYESIYRNHIQPFLGNRLLTKIHPADIEDFVELLKENGRSDDRARRARKLLGSICYEAIRRRLAHTNPVQALRQRHRSRRTEVHQQQNRVFVPEREAVRRLIDTAGRTDTTFAFARRQNSAGRLEMLADDSMPACDHQIAINRLRERFPDEDIEIQAYTPARWIRPLLATLAFSAVRIGEARGLEWSNLLDGSIRVLKAVDKYNVRDAVKTAAGIRFVPIGPFLTNTLEAWRPDGAEPGDLMFPSRAGTPIHYNNLNNRHFHLLLIVCGILDEDGNPAFTIHDLRHFAVSLWIDEGATVNQVAEWVGHEDPAFTLSMYAHLFAARRMDRSAATAGEASVMGTGKTATHTQHIGARRPSRPSGTRLSRKR